jgi:hypothetical protein
MNSVSYRPDVGGAGRIGGAKPRRTKCRGEPNVGWWLGWTLRRPDWPQDRVLEALTPVGGAQKPRVVAGVGSGGGELFASSSVFVECDAVDAEGEADEVDVLSCVANRVGASEPEGVVEVTVDGFGVVASGVEPAEVAVAGRDRSDVLGAVEPATFVLGVAV